MTLKDQKVPSYASGKSSKISIFSKANGARLSLESYESGKEWEPRKSTGGERMIVIGETLFRFEREFDGDRTMICASENYGLTWSLHSEVPHNIWEFETLTVNTRSGVHVYLFGSFRYKDPSFFQDIAEVWVSTDWMKTFELVTEDAGFRDFEDAGFRDFELYASCVRSDGSFLIIGRTDRFACSWISYDCGKTWQNLYQHDFSDPDIRYAWPIIPRKMVIVSYDNRLFSLGDAGNLMISENGGLTWYHADVPFVARAIIRDRRLNRLICFSYNESYELCSGGTVLKQLDLEWESHLPRWESYAESESYVPQSKYDVLQWESYAPESEYRARQWDYYIPEWESDVSESEPDVPDSFLDEGFYSTMIEPFMFASGAIYLQGIHARSGSFSLVSIPRRDVLRDKMMLSMLFAMFGIHSGVFTSFISPFIFPF